MASVSRDAGGKRRILFVAPDGKRKAIRLGKVSQRTAEQVKFRIEQLLEAKLTGYAVDADTAQWIGAGPRPHRRYQLSVLALGDVVPPVVGAACGFDLFAGSLGGSTEGRDAG